MQPPNIAAGAPIRPGNRPGPTPLPLALQAHNFTAKFPSQKSPCGGTTGGFPQQPHLTKAYRINASTINQSTKYRDGEIFNSCKGNIFRAFREIFESFLVSVKEPVFLTL